MIARLVIATAALVGLGGCDGAGPGARTPSPTSGSQEQELTRPAPDTSEDAAVAPREAVAPLADAAVAATAARGTDLSSDPERTSVSDGRGASVQTGAADGEDVAARVSRAVAKIELFKGKRSMSYGTGFFISADGLFATNYHVISDVLERQHAPVFTFGPNGRAKEVSFEFLRCMDRRDIDLCLLRLDHQPSHYLEVGDRRPRVGDEMITIGNPKGGDFSVARGEIEKIYADIHRAIPINDYIRNRRVEVIRMNAELRKGYSGGPVVDAQGRLLGINSVIMRPPKGKKDQRPLFLAISVRELDRYIKKKAPFDLEAFTKEQIRKNPILMTPADELSETQIKKACRTLQKDECIAGIKAACGDRQRKSECKRLRAYFRTLLSPKKPK